MPMPPGMLQQAIAKAPKKERKQAAGKLINMMGKIAKAKGKSSPMPDALPAGASMGAPGQPMPPPQGMGSPVPGMKKGGSVRGTGIARKGFGRGEMR